MRRGDKDGERSSRSHTIFKITLESRSEYRMMETRRRMVLFWSHI